MTTAIRDATIRLGIEQLPADLKAPKLDGLIKEAKTATAQIDKLVDTTVAGQKEMQSQATKTEAAFDKLAITQIKSAKDATDGNLKLFEGLRTSGDGAFTLARGFALVGVSGEENLRKVVESIAAAQGAFDIYRGGVDVIKGAVEATRSWADTSIALRVAMNPVLGVVGVGLAGAIGTGLAAWKLWGDAAEKETQRSIEATERATKALEAELKKQELLVTQSRDRREFQTTEAQLEGIDDRLAGIRSNQSERFESRQRLVNRIAALEEKRSRITSSTAGASAGPGARPFELAQLKDVNNRIASLRRALKAARAQPLIPASERDQVEELLKDRTRISLRQAEIRQDQSESNESRLENEMESLNRTIQQQIQQEKQGKAEIILERIERPVGERSEFENLKRRATDKDGFTDFDQRDLLRLGAIAPKEFGSAVRSELTGFTPDTGPTRAENEAKLRDIQSKFDQAVLTTNSIARVVSNIKESMDELAEGFDRVERLENGIRDAALSD